MKEYKKAYFGAGCFWGVEYYFKKLDGVISSISGYMNGEMKNPTYQDICSGTTGHIEVVEVTYDDRIDYKSLVKYFFEIHNPFQKNGQGNDIGSQYISAILYGNDEEKNIINELIDILQKKQEVATKLIYLDNIPFYKAEEYHQEYYFKNGKTPYCHHYTKRF
jgi:peptide methionine sulfoxide reductase msrA/msrB